MVEPGRHPPVIRRVHLPDAQAMDAFLRGLGGVSRRNRFHGSVNGVSRELLRRLVDADGERHAAWVACVWGPHGEEIVGEAVWYLTEPAERSAEFAISVSDAWQGRGLGDALMRKLLDGARASGVRELYGDVLQGNGRMLAFVRRHGMYVGFGAPPDEGGVVRVGCRLPAREPAGPVR